MTDEEHQGDTGGGDTGTAFAAGVAAATAAQASEEAEEANGRAEVAADTSQAAVETAYRAADTAEEAREEAAVTRAELDGVREQLGALADAHAELLTTLKRGAGGETAPAPERKGGQAAEETGSGDKDTGDTDKPAKSGGGGESPRYGSKRWFG